MDDLHNDLAAHVADELASVSALHIGDRVTILPDAAFARLGLTGHHGRGVVESVVTDTPPDPERGPLYHIRLTEPGASGWLGTGYSRNYADELASANGGGRLLAPIDVKSGICDECGLIETADYCNDCGMWVCENCWHTHDEQDEMEADDDD